MKQTEKIDRTGIVEAFEVTIDIIIERDGAGFHVYSPNLKGYHTSGDTEEEAIKNMKDALSAYLQSLIKHGELDKIIRRKKDEP